MAAGEDGRGGLLLRLTGRVTLGTVTTSASAGAFGSSRLPVFGNGWASGRERGRSVELPGRPRRARPSRSPGSGRQRLRRPRPAASAPRRPVGGQRPGSRLPGGRPGLWRAVGERGPPNRHTGRCGRQRGGDRLESRDPGGGSGPRPTSKMTARRTAWDSPRVFPESKWSPWSVPNVAPRANRRRFLKSAVGSRRRGVGRHRRFRPQAQPEGRPARQRSRTPAGWPGNSGSTPHRRVAACPVAEGPHRVPYLPAHAEARRAVQRGRVRRPVAGGARQRRDRVRQGHVRVLLLPEQARADAPEPFVRPPGAQVAALRKRKIWVLAYYMLTWNPELADRHPEWLVVHQPGDKSRPKPEEVSDGQKAFTNTLKPDAPRRAKAGSPNPPSRPPRTRDIGLTCGSSASPGRSS